MHFISASITHTGGRSANQDFAGAAHFDEAACWVVADGLGGHQGGEVASETAVLRVLEAFGAERAVSEAALRSYVTYAQETLLLRQQAFPSLATMRTTLVVLLTDYAHVLWGHIGDTRLYHFREGKLLSQTKDHSVPQALVDAGTIEPGDIRTHRQRNRLLQALGSPRTWHLDVAPIRSVQAGDAFLMCTDGFWEYVLEDEMADDLVDTRHPKAWLACMAARLRARVRGEHDNYTALAVLAV